MKADLPVIHRRPLDCHSTAIRQSHNRHVSGAAGAIAGKNAARRSQMAKATFVEDEGAPRHVRRQQRSNAPPGDAPSRAASIAFRLAAIAGTALIESRLCVYATLRGDSQPVVHGARLVGTVGGVAFLVLLAVLLIYRYVVMRGADFRRLRSRAPRALVLPLALSAVVAVVAYTIALVPIYHAAAPFIVLLYAYTATCALSFL